MNKVEYYTKNRKVYHYEPTAAERKEIQKMRRKQLMARIMAEKLSQERWIEEHKGGYCPKCFLLKPMTGICPTCD